MGNTIAENRVLLFRRRNKGKKSNFGAYIFTDHCHGIILCSDYRYFVGPSCSTETPLSVSPLQYYSVTVGFCFGKNDFLSFVSLPRYDPGFVLSEKRYFSQKTEAFPDSIKIIAFVLIFCSIKKWRRLMGRENVGENNPGYEDRNGNQNDIQQGNDGFQNPSDQGY